jgi:hypothetical protein
MELETTQSIKTKRRSAETIYVEHPESSYGIFCYNSVGDLFLNSDWGFYGYAWRSFGDNFKEFLKNTNSDYVVGKFNLNHMDGELKRKLSPHKIKHLKNLIDAFINELKNEQN